MDLRNIGKRAKIHGPVLKHERSPRISVFQVGCFMDITPEPSALTILVAMQRANAKSAPKPVKTTKLMYVPLPTAFPVSFTT